MAIPWGDFLLYGSILRETLYFGTIPCYNGRKDALSRSLRLGYWFIGEIDLLMFKRVAKRIIRFFTDIYSDSVGVYDPKVKKAKVKVGEVFYWVIGLILCFLIPAALVYIEVGEFDWNVFRFIWSNEAMEGLYGDTSNRVGYYLSCLGGNLYLLMAGGLTPYRINGRYELLGAKRFFRCFPFLYIAGIAMFILAMIEQYCY